MALFGKKKKAADEVAPMASPFDEQPAQAEPAAAPAPAPTPAAPKLQIRPDVYTLLLGLAAAALTVAAVLLYLNIQAYGPNPLSGIPRV